MKKKFRAALALRCKDLGLTDKAIDKLTELGCEGLDDDASEEDINTKVDAVFPFAQAMQSEITRKTANKQPQSVKQSKKEGSEEGENENETEVPDWFKTKMKGYDEALQKLQGENEALKAERTKSERSALISEKAKKLGIPDYLIKRVSFSDDVDLDKELKDFRQDLVNHNLVPREQTGELGDTDAEAKAAAKAWAESLPSM